MAKKFSYNLKANLCPDLSSDTVLHDNAQINCVCVYTSNMSRHRTQGHMGMVCTKKNIYKDPGGGDIMKEPIWTFDINYLTQNNWSS